MKSDISSIYNPGNSIFILFFSLQTKGGRLVSGMFIIFPFIAGIPRHRLGGANENLMKIKQDNKFH